MPDVNLTSTTDTDAEVQAALDRPQPAPAPGSAPTVSPTPPPPAPTPETQAPPAAAAPPAESDEDAEAPEGEAAEPKKPSKAQKRINELTRLRYEAEGRAQAEKARADTLARQLAEASKGAKPAEPTPAAAPSPQPDATDANEPKQEAFETYEAWIAALVKYRTDKAVDARLAEDRARQQAAEQVRVAQEVRANYAARTAEAKARHADYEAVVGQDLPVSDVMTHIILTSEVGPEISYYLGQHPDECAALAAISGSDAIRAMGKLEARVEANLEASGTPPAPTTPRTSKAPPPITPVRAATTAPTLDPEKMDFQQYKAYREEQLRQRGGRR